jgi:hypothetical protein
MNLTRLQQTAWPPVAQGLKASARVLYHWPENNTARSNGLGALSNALWGKVLMLSGTHFSVSMPPLALFLFLTGISMDGVATFLGVRAARQRLKKAPSPKGQGLKVIA